MRAMRHFTLLTLGLLVTLIRAHGSHGTGKKSLSSLVGGASLVMENYSGHIIVRPARDTENDKLPVDVIGTTVKDPNTGNKRVRLNKNSNKSNNQARRGNIAGNRKHNSNRSTTANRKDLQQIQRHQSGEHQHRTQNNLEDRSRANKNGTTCRYAKSSWTECDVKTNIRTRTLSLKKGESYCLPTRTIQKKCKKVCRYEKGLWSECKAGQMTREEKLKTSEDGSHLSCNPVRTNTKKCSSGNVNKARTSSSRPTKIRKHKDKGTPQVSSQV